MIAHFFEKYVHQIIRWDLVWCQLREHAIYCSNMENKFRISTCNISYLGDVLYHDMVLDYNHIVDYIGVGHMFHRSNEIHL